MSTYKADNLIVKLTFEFSLDIIIYAELLEQERKFNMTKQIWRSGTAIGALVNEAQNAESKSDFIHKLKIAAKEGDETDYWLQLCKFSKTYPDCESLINTIEVINKIINKIIGTTRKLNNIT